MVVCHGENNGVRTSDAVFKTFQLYALLQVFQVLSAVQKDISQ